MRILIATDAWEPQINGVVRTYQRLIVEAAKLGAEVTILSPSDFKSLALPVYPEIRLALPAIARARRIIRAGQRDAGGALGRDLLGQIGRRLRRGLRQQARHSHGCHKHNRDSRQRHAQPVTGLTQPTGDALQQ